MGGGWGQGGESPLAADVLAIKSADGQSNDGGTPGFAVALHTCRRHFGCTESHVGWKVDNWLKIYLFITARQGESGRGPLHLEELNLGRGLQKQNTVIYKDGRVTGGPIRKEFTKLHFR